MSKVSDKDFILKKLKNNGLDCPIEYTFDTTDLFQLIETYQIELEQDGYIRIEEGRRDVGFMVDYKKAYITRTGGLFINNGGYTAQEKRLRSDKWWGRGEFITAVLALIVSILSLLYSYRSGETGRTDFIEQRQAIDSLKSQLKQMNDSISRPNRNRSINGK